MLAVCATIMQWSDKLPGCLMQMVPSGQNPEHRMLARFRAQAPNGDWASNTHQALVAEMYGCKPPHDSAWCSHELHETNGENNSQDYFCLRVLDEMPQTFIEHMATNMEAFRSISTQRGLAWIWHRPSRIVMVAVTLVAHTSLCLRILKL